MAIIRKVFGPFHPEQTNPLLPTHTDLRWYFNGIRGDRTMAHWVLIFDPRIRKWTVSNVPLGSNLVGGFRKALVAQKVNTYPKETVHPDAWLDDSPVMEGRITDILKSKLSAEDIAKATALAITRR